MSEERRNKYEGEEVLLLYKCQDWCLSHRYSTSARSNYWLILAKCIEGGNGVLQWDNLCRHDVEGRRDGEILVLCCILHLCSYPNKCRGVLHLESKYLRLANDD